MLTLTRSLFLLCVHDPEFQNIQTFCKPSCEGPSGPEQRRHSGRLFAPVKCECVTVLSELSSRHGGRFFTRDKPGINGGGLCSAIG